MDKFEELSKAIDFQGFKGKPSVEGGKILLHTCCAPCSSYVVFKLKYFYKMDITAYYYNPNIHPEEEYERRYSEMEKLAEFLDFKLIKGVYDKESWFKKTEKLKNEPEGGRRCYICYAIRLNETAKKAKELGFDYFTTTLTVSPHMKHHIINKIGKNFEKKYGIKFLEENFKKQNGYLYSVRISKYLKLYRQHYCGCLYSIPDNLILKRES